VKGSRYITHIKRLDNLERTVSNFTRRIQPLQENLGPLLCQLPPNFKPDLPRLELFLKGLPARFSHAVEFRHPYWFSDVTFALLRNYMVASVSMSSLRMPLNFTVAAGFIYIRFHGLLNVRDMIIPKANCGRGPIISDSKPRPKGTFLFASIMI
jgi:uncharacterized protein YecE (DUF72 family)